MSILKKSRKYEVDGTNYAFDFVGDKLAGMKKISNGVETPISSKTIEFANVSASDEALNAYKLVTKFEQLRRSLEPSHPFSVAIKESKKFSDDTIVVVNSCGDAYKDREILKKRFGKKYV